MKYLVKFFVIFFFLIYSNIAYSNNTIVYINMKQIINNSLAGISINQEIDKIHKSNIVEFNKIQDELKLEEDKILSQKNILSEDEYFKKINLFKKKVKNYQNDQNKKMNLLNEKKIKATKELLKNLNTILTEYSTKNDISFILKKDNVIIAKKSLDITGNVITILNERIKKIELN